MSTFSPYPTPDVAAYVQCRDLFKIFKLADRTGSLEVVALRGVDLDIAPGEVTAIVGASGSGKTTLLNILAGLERPSAGQVRVGQRDLLNISERDLVIYRRQEVGFVWQSTSRNLVPYLNVRDNIELPMLLQGGGAKVPRSQRQQRSSELLASMHMEDKAHRYPDQLSGGEQQRVAIGVALANITRSAFESQHSTPSHLPGNPVVGSDRNSRIATPPVVGESRPPSNQWAPLLLADEPTGELDTQMADEIFELMREMNRTFGVTVVVVTHYPGVARHVGRVVHIRDGRISAESFMQTTYRRPGTGTGTGPGTGTGIPGSGPGSGMDNLLQQEYLVVDRVGRLQLPPDHVEQLRRNSGVGAIRESPLLAAADYGEGQVTLRPAGRPDSAPTPVRPQPEAQPASVHPGQAPPSRGGSRTAPTQAEEPEPVQEEEAPAQAQAQVPEPAPEPAQEPDPHAMFRRPTNN